jgi:ribonuclease HII
MGISKSDKLEKLKLKLVEMSVYENELYNEGNMMGSVKYIAGVDEVGRGPLAGPVVAAAVILPQDFDILGIDDSKKLSEKRREALYDEIKKYAIAYSIGLMDNNCIDDINILEATKEAMTSAIDGLSIKPDHILIDALTLRNIYMPQTGIIKGDAKSVSIAAASILAKVTRDRMMVEYHNEYPYYAFDSNKGYGTAAHYEGLDEYGLCPLHRKTFLRKYFNK